VAIDRLGAFLQLFCRFVESKSDEVGNDSFCLLCGFVVASSTMVVYDWSEQYSAASRANY
jgi:hypothetical protein